MNHERFNEAYRIGKDHLNQFFGYPIKGGDLVIFRDILKEKVDWLMKDKTLSADEAIFDAITFAINEFKNAYR